MILLSHDQFTIEILDESVCFANGVIMKPISDKERPLQIRTWSVEHCTSMPNTIICTFEGEN